MCALVGQIWAQLVDIQAGFGHSGALVCRANRAVVGRVQSKSGSPRLKMITFDYIENVFVTEWKDEGGDTYG
jgi:hypothetical protein